MKEIDVNNPANKWESMGTKDGIIIHSKPSDSCIDYIFLFVRVENQQNRINH